MNPNPPSRREGTSDSISGILLAGGKSRRMGGVNKALLKVGGRRIIERAADALTRVFGEVIVITNTPDDFSFLGLPLFQDVRPGLGSLGGLYTGLKVCSGNALFLVACDMPFVNTVIIDHMMLVSRGHDVTIPRIGGWLEPMHAIYSRRCLPYVERLLDNRDLKIINLFHSVDVLELDEEQFRHLDPDFHFIMNLNTPEDLQRARQIAILVDGK